MKALAVTFSPEALDDIERLVDWIARKAGPEIAAGYLTRLESYCRNLAFGSKRGQARDDVRPGLRTVGFERRITVAFTVTDDSVVILRLFYGGRDWEERLVRTRT
ncbi:MAG: type II toxin-antitoxin system RelE/ParE family toxin [Geminicoccaceae bacterium]|nr:type II toxin-antitoxin system RelE/ParE family toxin [Geminicoccaceae bacterium]